VSDALAPGGSGRQTPSIYITALLGKVRTELSGSALNLPHYKVSLKLIKVHLISFRNLQIP